MCGRIAHLPPYPISQQGVLCSVRIIVQTRDGSDQSYLEQEQDTSSDYRSSQSTTPGYNLQGGAALVQTKIEFAGEDGLAGNLGGEWGAAEHNAEGEAVNSVKKEGDEATVPGGGENGGLQGGAGGGAGGGGGNGGEEWGMLIFDKAMCFLCQENPYEYRTYCAHQFRVCEQCIGRLRGCPRCRQPLGRKVHFRLHPRRQEANHAPLPVPPPHVPIPPQLMQLELPVFYPPPMLVPEHEHPSTDVVGLKISSDEDGISYNYLLPDGAIRSCKYPW